MRRWCGRLYLLTFGRPPTPAEIDRGQGDPSPKPRAGWPVPRTCSGRCSIPRSSCSITDRHYHDARGRPRAAHILDQEPLNRREKMLLLALLSAPAWGLAMVRADDASAPTYERDIKPILARTLHRLPQRSKQDDLDLSGGLALDSFEGVLAGTKRREDGRAGSIGDESELVATVDRSGCRPHGCRSRTSRLPDAQQELIRRWIDAGAPRGSAPAVAANELIE